MVLNTRQWGRDSPNAIVCIHGLTHHGGVFEAVGRHFASRGHFVIAVDLRGHGESGAEPPWSTETHVQDILETLDNAGVERASWIGHSYGGRVAAALAATALERTDALALLEAPSQVTPERALRAIEIERLDWSFATVDGAIQAMMSSDLTVAPPQDLVEAFVKDDVRRGPDGRFRFRFSPGAVVVAWNDLTLPPPPIVGTPTLLVYASQSLADTSERDREYEVALADLHERAEVPNGHNVLWEAPSETVSAIERLLGRVEAPRNDT